MALKLDARIVSEEFAVQTSKGIEWKEMVVNQMPKRLGDLFESLVGAIYVDSWYKFGNEIDALMSTWNALNSIKSFKSRLDYFEPENRIIPITRIFEEYFSKELKNSKQKNWKIDGSHDGFKVELIVDKKSYTAITKRKDSAKELAMNKFLKSEIDNKIARAITKQPSISKKFSVLRENSTKFNHQYYVKSSKLFSKICPNL